MNRCHRDMYRNRHPMNQNSKGARKKVAKKAKKAAKKAVAKTANKGDGGKFSTQKKINTAIIHMFKTAFKNSNHEVMENQRKILAPQIAL